MVDMARRVVRAVSSRVRLSSSTKIWIGWIHGKSFVETRPQLVVKGQLLDVKGRVATRWSKVGDLVSWVNSGGFGFGRGL
jgi:hypothetical protein